MPLDDRTIKALVSRFGELCRIADELRAKFDAVEHEAAAIRAIVHPDDLKAYLEELSQQPPEHHRFSKSKPNATIAERIVAALQEFQDVASPVAIAEFMAFRDSFGEEDPKTLRAKVSAELSRMLSRDDAIIEKTGRGKYRLKQSRPEESLPAYQAGSNSSRAAPGE